MIKFFRHIRQTLIMENKTFNYLKYAIGEIVLVVIGILIALQINNWNENRKDRFIEKKILQSLNNDLQKDIYSMKYMISNDSLIYESNSKLIQILKDSHSEYQPYQNKMFGLINRFNVFYPQRMGYESLKSKGLEILLNDSLKSQIVNLYDFQYVLIAESIDVKKQLYLDTNLIFNEELETVTIDDKILKIPNDFNELKKNTKFLNHLTHISAEQLNFLKYDKKILSIIETIKLNIEKELVND